MQYEVFLKYHEDDATSSWGFAPIKTINQERSFNAFWSASGIFHDVFEHYMEGILPYYSGKGFMTLWGEMAASAHGLAYADIGIEAFKHRRGYKLGSRDYTIDTYQIIQEAIYDKKENPQDCVYIEYEGTKETCLVPHQKELDWDGCQVMDTIQSYEGSIDVYAKDKGVDYRDIIWKPGIRRNYIYGWKLAQKIIGKDVNHSYQVLDQFLEDWNDICVMFNVETLMLRDSDHGLNGIKFTVENKGKLKVTAKLVENYTGEEFDLDQLECY